MNENFDDNEDRWADIKLNDFVYKHFEEPDNDGWYRDHIYESCWGFSINLNDTFGWALAMSDFIWGDDWDQLIPLVNEYRMNAIHAYFALKLDVDVIDPLQTDEYFKCKQIIRELKDDHGLFTWFEYGEGLTTIERRRSRKELKNDIYELCELFMDIKNRLYTEDENAAAEKFERQRNKFINKLI